MFFSNWSVTEATASVIVIWSSQISNFHMKDWFLYIAPEGDIHESKALKFHSVYHTTSFQCRGVYSCWNKTKVGPSVGLQIVEAYLCNLSCWMSALGRRVQSLHGQEGHTTQLALSCCVHTCKPHGLLEPQILSLCKRCPGSWASKLCQEQILDMAGLWFQCFHSGFFMQAVAGDNFLHGCPGNLKLSPGMTFPWTAFMNSVFMEGLTCVNMQDIACFPLSSYSILAVKFWISAPSTTTCFAFCCGNTFLCLQVKIVQ